jgi:hypothetical protein
MFVSHLRQVDGFLYQSNWHNWYIIESGVKHHNQVH